MCSRPGRFLILETSGSVGRVAAAEGEAILRTRELDETRRHARDLAPAVARLLEELAWKPTDVTGVIVSQGPGSYTGLRVGIISAKAFCYATGAALIAVPTFQAIAAQAPVPVSAVEVLADAQQELIYVQRFTADASSEGLAAESALAIRPFSAWLGERDETDWLSGPGLRRFRDQLPAGSRTVEPERWDALPETLLRLGLARYETGEKDDPMAVEPIYLRPSSAEEKWDALGR